MLNRPRCRDWSPLATQQLRLRNLIQITGHNIVADPKSSIYFTLHLTSMSAPFFTSEKVESVKNAIWAEINCQTINKSTSQFVCVRVWQSTKHHKAEHICAEHHHSLSPQSPTSKMTRLHDLSVANSASEQKHFDSADKVIFMWGVYLSGLIPISKRSDVKLKNNGLVFYMHGGFFTSADYLQPECIPKQYNYFHTRKEFHNEQITNTNTTTSNGKKNTTCKNCDSLVSVNNSNGAEPKGSVASPSGTHGHASISDSSRGFNETNESDDWPSAPCPAHDDVICDGDCCKCKQSEANALKMRYTNKEFFKLEIRNSYHVKKLLLLQEKQRIFRNKMISCNEVVEKICMRSAFCLNLKLIANKGMFYRPRGNPSIGRTLNRLLTAQPEQPKPEDLLKAQDLRRRIESAKFRCRFLTMERDRHKVNLRQLQDKCGKLSDENIDKESSLMANYRELSRNREIAIEQNAIFMRQNKLYDKVRELIECRQKHLLVQLRDIYSINVDEEKHRFHMINGIYLPNADEYMDAANSNLGSPATAPSICVGLGYVAHIVLLCSTILNIPLRNRILYYGSASKIRDDIKVLSEHDREFPLFCRSVPPTDSLLYAVFLLNQNISQIKFMLNIHSHREDIRATLPNLYAILNAAETSTQRVLKAPSANVTTLSISNEQDVPMSSVSNTSIDIIFPVPVKKTYSASDNNLNGPDSAISTNKLSRTNGSCSDEQLTRRRERLNRVSTALEPRFYSEPTLGADATLRLKVHEN